MVAAACKKSEDLMNQVLKKATPSTEVTPPTISGAVA